MRRGSLRSEPGEFTKGEPQYYLSSAGFERGFCRDRGSSLVFRAVNQDWISIQTGSLDDPEVAPSTGHLNFSLAWLVLAIYKGEVMLVTNEQLTLQKLRAKPVAVLAVLLLAALQLTNATHQFDHTANDLSETCSICVQLDRLDDVSVTDTALAAGTTPYTGRLDLAPSFLPSVRPLSAQARAPPFS